MSRKLHVKNRSFKPLTPLQQVKALAEVFGRDKESEELALYYLTEIKTSHREIQKMAREFKRIDKKTQAILDKLH